VAPTPSARIDHLVPKVRALAKVTAVPIVVTSVAGGPAVDPVETVAPIVATGETEATVAIAAKAGAPAAAAVPSTAPPISNSRS
jgi:hypothetical protein